MRKCLAVLGVAAAAILLTTSAFAANRGVNFTGIGFIEDPGQWPASAVWSMNPQGTVFLVSPNYYGNYAMMWTREGGWGTWVGDSLSICRMSADGTIMGTGLYPGSDPAYGWPGVWGGAADVWDPIPAPDDFAPCGSSRLSFYDMGGNGDFATGLTWSGCSVARAFRWDKATNTTVDLGSPAGNQGRGNAISNDGNTVVGWSQMLNGGWRGARWDDGTWSWVDGQGNNDPMHCAVTGKSCTSNTADPKYGCPDEYVDDASCQNMGTCTGGVCVGGVNAGQTCSGYWQCGGSCVGGPSDGAYCYYDGACPDTQVCVDNPAWSNAAYKGEARDVSDSGHVVGTNFGYDYPEWNSAWRQNPDGSFTEIPTAPSFPDVWEPARISEDGKTVVGMIGNPWWGSIPAFWNEGTGTVDLQLFLVGQGLDDLYFWYLTQLNDVSADGTVMAGMGYNPDGWQEGFIVDLKKMWVCHAPPGHPENARTLGVDFSTVGDHLAHGDFLGTCEFLNSGGLSRAATLLESRNHGYTPAQVAARGSRNPAQNPFFNPKAPVSWDYSALGRPNPTVLSNPSFAERPSAGTSVESKRINDLRDRIQNKTRTRETND